MFAFVVYWVLYFCNFLFISVLALFRFSVLLPVSVYLMYTYFFMFCGVINNISIYLHESISLISIPMLYDVSCWKKKMSICFPKINQHDLRDDFIYTDLYCCRRAICLLLTSTLRFYTLRVHKMLWLNSRRDCKTNALAGESTHESFLINYSAAICLIVCISTPNNHSHTRRRDV